jgi:hypothetical protein
MGFEELARWPFFLRQVAMLARRSRCQWHSAIMLCKRSTASSTSPTNAQWSTKLPLPELPLTFYFPAFARAIN